MLRGQLNYARTFARDHALSIIGGAGNKKFVCQEHHDKRYGYDPVTGNHSTPLMEDVATDPSYDKAVSYSGYLTDAPDRTSWRMHTPLSTAPSPTPSGTSMSSAGTVRSDGSNNFGSDEQFNLNWSVSGAWNIDEEPWM